MNVIVLLIILLIYGIFLMVCFGKIAGRLGRNPYLFGILSGIIFINIIPFAMLAFGSKSPPPKIES